VGQDDNFGLAASGRGGRFSVEVLSRPAGGWSLSVQSPAWCVEFEVASPGTVGELAAFLRSHAGRAEFAELVIGMLGGLTVRMVKDDEFGDRFFLRAAGGGWLVEFTLAGGIEGDFAQAVAEAAAEFDAEPEPPA
jgi:hypothetical protein